MSEEELIETLKEFEKSRVDKLKEPSKNLFYAIMKIADERDKYRIVLDKIKEYCKENSERDYGEYDRYGDVLDYINELLEEIE